MHEDSRKPNATPVFKKGKKDNPGNYRPVSLTSIPGKMMEQLILDVVSKQVQEKSARTHQGEIMLDQMNSLQ